jgi:hypothetical protein
MSVDILQEACEKGASEYLGSLEWPLETVDAFWEVMEARFAKTALTRTAEYERLEMRPGQTYQRYADLLMQKTYGLGLPRETLLRFFMKTMLNGNVLRPYLTPSLHLYPDVRALATAVEEV